MTDHVTSNTAGHGSTTAIQASNVYNSPVYQVLPEDPPSREYEVGVRFLEDGVPSRARELIGNAIARGYDGVRVRFHWLLAVLSKRSHRDLTSEERQGLEQVKEKLPRYPDDEWKDALKAVLELVDCLGAPGSDPEPALKRLRSLPPRQYDTVIRHLDLVLTGGMRESLWSRTRRSAQETRLSGDRTNRVWAYFHPEPAAARARRAAAKATTLGDHVRAAACSALFVLAVGHLGRLVLAHAEPVPILAYLLVLAAGYTGARHGSRWHYAAMRLRAKDREYTASRRNTSAPAKGFANGVDRSFDHYSAKYTPEDVDRDRWLKETAGIRRALRDEVVEIYRESRVHVGEVNWLIRYLVRDVRKRWLDGTLREYRDRYRVKNSTKLWSALSCAVLTAAAVQVIVTAFQESPFTAVLAALAALVGGGFAVPAWLGIVSEHRRFTEDEAEHRRVLEERKREHLRWKEKLDATRPSETEMEAWLHADKMVVLDAALRHHRLAWHDIIAHAFLQTPQRPCKRARDRAGPWRYSRYEIRTFLITAEGVREVVSDVDFEKAETGIRERDNFHFESISSVQVRKEGRFGSTLHITLMNGPAKNVVISDSRSHDSRPDEDPSELFRTDLDAAGFAHTLRILEGIAAEGRTWLDRTRRPGADN